MGGKHNKCCCAACEITADDFNRADANPPTGSWDVIGVATEWKIESNQLVCVTPGPIVNTHRPKRLRRSGKFYNVKIYFRVVGATNENNIHSIICGYTDEDNFLYIRLTKDPVNATLWPEFIIRASGVDTVVMDKTTHPGGSGWGLDGSGNWIGKICFSEKDWTLDTGTPSESGSGMPVTGSQTQWTLDEDTGGMDTLGAGVGIAGFLEGTFDDFALHHHWESIAKCDYCSCICVNRDDHDDYQRIPEKLIATFVALFDESTSILGSSCLDGLTITLEQGEYDGGGTFLLNPMKDLWSKTLGDSGTPTDIIMRFNCQPQLAPNSHKLTIGIPSLSGDFKWGTGPQSPGLPSVEVDWDVSTCTPLSLYFGELEGGVVTCESIPGGGGFYGYRSNLCPGSDCVPQTPENEAALRALRWAIVITEAP